MTNDTTTDSKTVYPTREAVRAMGKQLEDEEKIVKLVEYALNFFDLEGTKPRDVPGFKSLVESAAYGIALMLCKIDSGDTNPRPIRGPVIICYNPINDTFDALISYKAVKALGLKYKYSGRVPK